MRNAIGLCLSLTIFFTSIFSTFFYEYAHGKTKAKINTAVVTFFEGRAEYKIKGEAKWNPLKEDVVLKEGDEVKTFKKARLELILPDSSVMRFSEDTQFKIMQLRSDIEVSTSVKLFLGKFYGSISRFIKTDSKFTVETKTAVTGVRGTTFRIDMEKDDSYLMRVYEGEIEVTNPPYEIPKPQIIGGPQQIPGPSEIEGPEQVTFEEWVEIVGALQQFSITPDGTRKKEKFSLEEDMKLDWVKWNIERDKLIER